MAARTEAGEIFIGRSTNTIKDPYRGVIWRRIGGPGGRDIYL